MISLLSRPICVSLQGTGELTKESAWIVVPMRTQGGLVTSYFFAVGTGLFAMFILTINCINFEVRVQNHDPILGRVSTE